MKLNEVRKKGEKTKSRIEKVELQSSFQFPNTETGRFNFWSQFIQFFVLLKVQIFGSLIIRSTFNTLLMNKKKIYFFAAHDRIIKIYEMWIIFSIPAKASILVIVIKCAAHSHPRDLVLWRLIKCRYIIFFIGKMWNVNMYKLHEAYNFMRPSSRYMYDLVLVGNQCIYFWIKFETVLFWSEQVCVCVWIITCIFTMHIHSK